MKTLVAVLLFCTLAAAQGIGGSAGIGGKAGLGGGLSVCCSDAFTGTSGTLLATHNANWTSIDGTWVVGDCQLGGGGTLQMVAAFDTCGAYYSASSADISQVVLPGGNTDNGFSLGPVIRASNANGKGYFMYFAGSSGGNYTSAEIAIGDAGSFLCSQVSTWAIASLHTLRMTASGTTISAYIDGTLMCSGTDSTYASGHPGIEINAGTGTYNLAGTWQSY